MGSGGTRGAGVDSMGLREGRKKNENYYNKFYKISCHLWDNIWGGLSKKYPYSGISVNNCFFNGLGDHEKGVDTV